MKKLLFVAVVGLFLLPTLLLADVQVTNPGYNVELFVSLGTTANDPRELTFDSAGNLYITHQNQGSITKIAPDKTVTKKWSSGYNQPWGLEFTQGSAYGDKAYVAQNTGHSIGSVSMSGQYSSFTSIASPSIITLDTVGNYGGYLYAGSTAEDGVYKILPNGTQTLFCDDFYKLSGGIEGLAFSPFSNYGSQMYIGVFSNQYDHGGLYSVDANGNSTRFGTDMIWAKNLNFDTTGFFGNALYASGIVERNTRWDIYSIDDTGDATSFAVSTFATTYGGLFAYTFGPDGAMYVFEGDGVHTDQIWRVTAIPEPMTFGLLGLGFLLCRKKR
ncbi:MAG: hypothetical protein ABFD91_17330 [Anaerohalosphaeraceae bacterium]